MRFALLLFLSAFLTGLHAGNFFYDFTARVTSVTANEQNYLGNVEPGSVLNGSFGVTDLPKVRPGEYQSIFLELNTPNETVRVDFPPFLFLWWREGDLELAWDTLGPIDLPWSLTQFQIQLTGAAGGSYPGYLGNIDLPDFSTATLDLNGTHKESNAEFALSLDLESITPVQESGPKFYIDSGIRFHTNAKIRSLAFAPECIWLGGSDFYRSSGRQPLERLFLNGEVDFSFDIVGGFSNADGSDPVIEHVVRLPDGDLFVAGHFSHFMQVAVGNYARLNPDGSLDPDFAKNRSTAGDVAGADGRITAIEVLPDGRVLLGGDFSKVDGLARAHLALVADSGELVSGWSCPVFDASDYFAGISDFALTPSGLVVYVVGDFIVQAEEIEGIFRLDITSGAAQELSSLNLPQAFYKQVALRNDGALVVCETVKDGGNVYIHLAPEKGGNDPIYLSHESSVWLDQVDRFTLLEYGRLFALGEFRDPETDRQFSQAVFSPEGQWLPDAFGQNIRIWPFETFTKLADDGAVWIFGDFDLELGTSDGVNSGWSHRPTKLSRFVEVLPPPVSGAKLVLGETQFSARDGGTVYVSLLRSGTTELLTDAFGGHLEDAWWETERRLNEGEDFVFPPATQSGFDFTPYDRLVSVPVSFLKDAELNHEFVSSAFLEPQYGGMPLNTSIAARTLVRIDVSDTSRERLVALQEYFPDATNTSEGYLDPDEDGRSSYTEILMRTDPRLPDSAPRLKLFPRLHPQDNQQVWMLEFPFDGGVEHGIFHLFQSTGGLSNWQNIAENNGLLSSERHEPAGDRRTLMYGDPYGQGLIGLRLDVGSVHSAFWQLGYNAY